MNEFKEIYLHMFYESAGTIPFDLNKYEEFLKTAIKIPVNETVLTEDKQLLIDIPSKFFNYCLSHQNELIPYKTVKILLKSSKHFNNVKNIPEHKLYIAVFDFDDDLAIRSFHYNVFNITDNNELLTAVKLFKKYTNDCSGFENIYNDIHICVINENSLNFEQTLHHELSHYLQTISGIHITNKLQVTESEFENPELNSIKALNITINDLNYYFSSKEFSVHVDDLCVNLLKTFNIYPKKQLWTFISDLNNVILNNDDFINTELFQLYTEVTNNDISGLIMLKAAKILNYKFDKIFKCIKNYLMKNCKK